MKLLRLSTRVIASLALGLGVLIAPLNSTVFAQTQDATNGLEISPVLVEVNGDAGKTYTIEVKVKNVTKSDLYFSSSVDDFGAKDETGTPSVMLDDSAEPLATSIKTWVDPIGNFSLKSTRDKIIPVTIRIPSNAEPGGHYGVVRFSGHDNESDAGNVGLVASAGTLVLVKVAGEASEALELSSFEASKNGTTGTLFESGPLTFVTRFKNTGSVHVKPTGQIEVKDGFGKTVEVMPVNDSKGNVLPASTRRFESTLNKGWLFGKYTADISIAYGTTGQAIVRSIDFWVIPWKLVFVVALVAVTAGYVLRTLIKRYNAYVIRKDKAREQRSKQKRK